jgi:hypothetical protein
MRVPSFDRCLDPEVHRMTAHTFPTNLPRRVRGAAPAVAAALLFGTVTDVSAVPADESDLTSNTPLEVST